MEITIRDEQGRACVLSALVEGQTAKLALRSGNQGQLAEFEVQIPLLDRQDGWPGSSSMFVYRATHDDFLLRVDRSGERYRFEIPSEEIDLLLDLSR